jgi:hypothetical protein
MQLGFAGTRVSPDIGPTHASGGTIYGDFDFVHNIGLEGDIHLASWRTHDFIGEDSYLLGPRYSFHYRRVDVYGKALFGIGRLLYQTNGNQGGYGATYKIYAFGGGLDIHTIRHLNIRLIDLEEQEWPGYNPGGLSPFATTAGLAYAFR